MHKRNSVGTKASGFQGTVCIQVLTADLTSMNKSTRLIFYTQINTFRLCYRKSEKYLGDVW